VHASGDSQQKAQQFYDTFSSHQRPSDRFRRGTSTGTRSHWCGASVDALCVILILVGAAVNRTTRQKTGLYLIDHGAATRAKLAGPATFFFVRSARSSSASPVAIIVGLHLSTADC